MLVYSCAHVKALSAPSLAYQCVSVMARNQVGFSQLSNVYSRHGQGATNGSSASIRTVTYSPSWQVPYIIRLCSSFMLCMHSVVSIYCSNAMLWSGSRNSRWLLSPCKRIVDAVHNVLEDWTPAPQTPEAICILLSASLPVCNAWRTADACMKFMLQIARAEPHSSSNLQSSLGKPSPCKQHWQDVPLYAKQHALRMQHRGTGWQPS